MSNGSSTEGKWCFAWYATSPKPADGDTRGALEKSSKWGNGDTITISFMDGTKASKTLSGASPSNGLPDWLIYISAGRLLQTLISEFRSRIGGHGR